MTSQLRRSGVSVGSNIAEGSRKLSPADKGRMFNIAETEAAEAMSVLDLSQRLRYGRIGEAQRLTDAYEEWLRMAESLRQLVVGERG